MKIKVDQLHFVCFPPTFQKLGIFSEFVIDKLLGNRQNEVKHLQFWQILEVEAKCKNCRVRVKTHWDTIGNIWIKLRVDFGQNWVFEENTAKKVFFEKNQNSEFSVLDIKILFYYPSKSFELFQISQVFGPKPSGYCCATVRIFGAKMNTDRPFYPKIP